jgi:hypothetical protein
MHVRLGVPVVLHVTRFAGPRPQHKDTISPPPTLKTINTAWFPHVLSVAPVSSCAPQLTRFNVARELFSCVGIVDTTKTDNPANGPLLISTRLPDTPPKTVRYPHSAPASTSTIVASTYTPGHHFISFLARVVSRRVVALLPRDFPRQPCPYNPSFDCIECITFDPFPSDHPILSQPSNCISRRTNLTAGRTTLLMPATS